MINAEISNITINDEELFNRVRAYAAGDGINRPAVTLEDAASIAAYGVREIVQEFPEATSYSDLVGKATSFLDEAKNPVTEVDVTFFYDTQKGPGSNIYEGTALTHEGETFEYYTYTNDREVRRGDTIRIVSQSLGLNFTGVIEELDWEPGSVSLSIGRKRYNLLDVVNGRRLAAERGEAALGLEKPISFRAIEGSPGVVVTLNPYVSQRAVGVEIYGDTTAGSLTPASGEISREYLLSRGVATRVELTQLSPGQTYYFRARSYDDAGNYSDLTDTISATAGFVKTGTIGPSAVTSSRIANNSITTNKFVSGDVTISDFGGSSGKSNSIRVSDGSSVVAAMGYIGDKTISDIDYGFWGALGTNVIIEGALGVESIDFYSPASASFFFENITTNVSSTGTLPAGSAGDRVRFIRINIGKVLTSPSTIESGETFYIINIPLEVKTDASGYASVGDVALSQTFQKRVGPTSIIGSALFNIGGYLNYHDTIPANTYTMSADIVQFLLKSYG